MTESAQGGVRWLASATFAFLTAGVASKVLSILTVPLLARLLAPDQLGMLDIAAGLAATVTTIAVLGSDNGVARFLTIDRRRAAVWGAAATIVASLSFLLLVGGAVAHTGLAQVLLGDARRGAIVIAAVAHGIANAAFVSTLNIIRLTGRPRRYAAASTGTLVVQSIGGVILAVLLPDPIVGILLWWGLVALVSGVAIVATSRPDVHLPGRVELTQVIRFGAPLVPGVIAWTIGDLGIRGALAHSADPALLGSYSIASRLVSVIALAISGFSLAWMPYVFGRSQRAGATAAFRDGALGLLALVGAIAISISALAPEAVAFLGGARYEAAANAVAPLAGGMILFAVMSVLAGAVALELRTAELAWSSVAGMVLQVAVATLLVPAGLLVGAALASLVGYGVAVAVVAVRLELRGRVDTTLCSVLAGTFLALLVIWLLVISHASLPIRVAILVSFLVAGILGVGRRLQTAWMA